MISMMELPQPQARPFSGIMNDIEKGQIRIPQFQRDFVWNMKKSAHLMDSILKGYPIGTLIFWRTKERLRTVKSIGNINVPEPDDGDALDFVLDGQQRLTSIFASLKGLKIKRENGKEEDFSNIYVDLNAGEDDQLVIIDISKKDKDSIIKLTDLLYGGIPLLASYPPEYLNKLDEFKKRIESYNYSIIQIKDAPIDIATEIFTRINVGGKPLTLFEIMVAKTYDSIKKFDLAEKFNNLIENLKPLNYETISDATVLQTVSLIIEKECQRKVILKLDKQDFIKNWENAVDAIERTVEYFIGTYRIPVSNLLPYSALIAPFAYFFYHHPDKPSGNKQRYLEDLFWRCALSARYSSSVESKLAQDVKRIDQILNNKQPKYDWSIDTSPEFIEENGWFNAGRSYIKSILCIYAYNQPKSFNDGAIVNIGNYFLKQANSKNYHHFFPKAYLKKKGEDDFYINHILNITIVDDFLNKRKIKAKPPSKYMKEFLNQIPQGLNDNEKPIDKLQEWMKTHLINDLDEFGIWDDQYDTFFQKRARLVSEELQKRIIEQEIDKTGQVSLEDDFEETEIE